MAACVVIESCIAQRLYIAGRIRDSLIAGARGCDVQVALQYCWRVACVSQSSLWYARSHDRRNADFGLRASPHPQVRLCCNCEKLNSVKTRVQEENYLWIPSGEMGAAVLSPESHENGRFHPRPGRSPTLRCGMAREAALIAAGAKPPARRPRSRPDAVAGRGSARRRC